MNLKRISLVLLVCAAVSPALGITPEARGLAMADAYSPFAKGAEGMWYNPATLGAVTLAGIDAGGAGELTNNALTLNELANFATGTDAKKLEAIDKIAKEGEWNANVKIVAGASADIMGVGLSVSQNALITGMDVSADTVEYSTFSKLRAGKNIYDLNGTFQGSAYREIGIGYGMELPIPLPMGKVSAGAVVKILQGTDYTLMSTKNHVDKVNPLNCTGSNLLAEGSSGKGFGVDLGAHAEFAVVDASLYIKNIASVISWDTDVQAGAVNTTTLLLPTGTTKETIKQTLPMTIGLGVGGHIPVVGTAAGAEIEMVGKGTTKGKTGDALDTSEAETRLRVGLEQSMLGIVNLRAGYVTGGKGTVTLGAGLGALVARLDAGVGIGLDGKSGSAGLSGSVSF
jgi:hypothetical protein